MNCRRLPSAWLLVSVLLSLVSASSAWSADTTAAAPHWDLDRLGQAPREFPAPEVTAPDVRSLFYEGPSYQGKPTRVFAYYAAPAGASAEKKVPAMVLVHGGGGTAFDRWVRLWTSRGYAAISMDLCGCLPIRKDPKKRGWKRHAAGGPPGWGGFDQIDQPATEQWTYHAVADVLLAHSLLRSRPEIDSDRIGLTGISWGGYLTCIVSGVDPRFRFAVPVYGCGFLGENSAWLAVFERMGSEKAGRWLSWWDPSVYLPRSSMPMLWVTGTNDFAYPMDSLQKSYRLPRGPRTLALRVRMPHGHGAAGENPGEIHAFADSILRGGPALAKITGQGRDGTGVWATYQSAVALAGAELTFTLDEGPWQKRKWETQPARLDANERRVTAVLPPKTKVYYINLIDSRKLVTSTEHEVLAAPSDAAQKTS